MAEKFINIFEEAERRAHLGDVDNVAQSLCRLLEKTVGSCWAAMYLLDGEGVGFTPGRTCNVPGEYLPLLTEIPLRPGKITLLKKLLREKQHLTIDAEAASGLFTGLAVEMLAETNVLVLPMRVNNRMIGTVMLSRELQAPPFTGAEITLIEDIVSNAALAVSYSVLFNESLDLSVEMGKRVDIIFALDEINKAISSSLSREKIIATAIQNIERIIQCDLVVLLEEENGQLSVMASHCLSSELPPEIEAGAKPDMTRSCAFRAFVKGDSCYINSLKARKKLPHLDRLLCQAGMQSLLAIPMIAKERMIGVLLLGDTDSGRFLKDDVFAVEKIGGQIAVALMNAMLYEDLENLFIGTVASLANAIDAKSAWTKGHSERVMRLAGELAAKLGLDDAAVERVRIGGLLHDIGKIGIIEALLEKPAKIAEDDFPPMRLHPEKGVAILAPIEQLKGVLPGILHHHEKYNGSGYPDGLKGEDIPIEARIIAVADAFDAMVSVRPYKQAYSIDDALQELNSCAGTQFDPVVVSCFCENVKRKMEGRQISRPEEQKPPS